MKNSKHTPGPWEIDAVSVSGQLAIIQDDACIALCRDKEQDWTPMNAEANAHLIAAAPEMLEALEFLMKRFGPLAVDSDPEAPPFRSTVTGEEIEQLIAKAKGGAK